MTEQQAYEKEQNERNFEKEKEYNNLLNTTIDCSLTYLNIIDICYMTMEHLQDVQKNQELLAFEQQNCYYHMIVVCQRLINRYIINTEVGSHHMVLIKFFEQFNKTQKKEEK
jgi:hypothetical protein